MSTGFHSDAGGIVGGNGADRDFLVPRRFLFGGLIGPKPTREGPTKGR